MLDPTPEQIEAAYQAWLNFPHKRGPQNAENAICAALVAAAGAAPQEPTSERCGDCGDKLDYVAGLDGQGCYPHCWRCWYKDHPVEIPVQVDEAKLAEIAVSEVEEFEATAGPDRPLSHVGISIARAIAKHLRGGGQ